MIDGVRFAKGHGTGNDFVILPDPDGVLDADARRWSRRSATGGGASAATACCGSCARRKHPEAAGMAGEAEWFMDYWNADGSFAEMCGNGARVFVRYLLSTGLATSVPGARPPGPAWCASTSVRRRSSRSTWAVRGCTGSSTAALGSLTLPGVAVDCGNPHLVCALSGGRSLDDLDLLRAPSYDPAVFPAGVNVEFTVPATVDGADLHVRMRVYERGSGETLSCGSGACAVAAVALRDAGLDRPATVTVDVPGGRLTVTLDGAACWLAGPAVLVATGEIDVAALSA